MVTSEYGNAFRSTSLLSYLGMKSKDLHVRPCTITHVDSVKRVIPATRYSQICYSVFFLVFIHIVIITKYLKNGLLHIFSHHQWRIQLIFGQLQKHASALVWLQDIRIRRVFTGLVGTWFALFCIRASHFQCIVGAQPAIQCLTIRTAGLIWRVWPRSLGMSVLAWQRHREIE